MSPQELHRPSLIKPAITTPFCIDFGWWKQSDSNWKIHLLSCLCEEHRQTFADVGNDVTIDWIDPETAEVRPVDSLMHILITHCAHQQDFITSFTTTVDVVFRSLLANGNEPLTPDQIAKSTGRSPEMILRTLTGPRVYKGIRPCGAVVKTIK